MTGTITLTRPLVGIDLETTGTNILKDRIVEISLVITQPDGTLNVFTRKVNPGIPIPEEASKVHGIYDADVADAPTFAQLAPEVFMLVTEGDLATYNGDQFDIPLLARELQEAGISWDPIAGGQHCIDVKQLFVKLEPRRLQDAVKLYLGRDHENAHSAEADTIATIQVLGAMTAHYKDSEDPEKQVPTTVEELAKFGGNGKSRVDLGGCFYRDEEGDICFNIGSDRGKKVASNPGFVRWMLGKDDFHPNTHAWCKRILAGETGPAPVVIYASADQKQEIIRLLNNEVISRQEKTKMLLNINRFDQERAAQAIDKLKKVIEERSEPVME